MVPDESRVSDQFFIPSKSEIIALYSRPTSEWTSLELRGFNLLTLAAIGSEYDMVHNILKGGFDPDANNVGHVTSALTECIKRQNFYGAVVLLQGGANPNGHDAEDQTPLHEAVRRNSLICVVLLLLHGASKVTSDISGRMPLDLAVHEDISSRLIARYL